MKPILVTLAGAVLSAALVAAPDAALAQVNEKTKSAAEAAKKGDPKKDANKAAKKKPKNMKEAVGAKKAEKK